MNENAANAMQIDGPVREELARIMSAAYRISANVGSQVKQILQLEEARPLTDEELEAMLVRVVEVLKAAAEQHGDEQALAVLQGDVHHIVSRLVQRRHTGKVTETANGKRHKPMLMAHNGIKVMPVSPRPMFHGKEISMDAG